MGGLSLTTLMLSSSEFGRWGDGVSFFLVGAAGGGAVGLITGAILGMADSDSDSDARSSELALRFAPTVSGGIAAAVSFRVSLQ